MLYRYKANPQIHVFSDASGSWGCGAYSGNTWFQFQWPADMGDCHISTKEMIPVVMAAIVWGHRWQGLSVCFHTDNTAVVALINQGSVRDSSLMHLMKCLSFVSAKFNFIFSSCNIMSWLMPSQEITSLFFSCTAPTRTHYQLSYLSPFRIY